MQLNLGLGFWITGQNQASSTQSTDLKKENSSELKVENLSAINREKKVELIFEALRKSPSEMKIWLHKMPKGGDLHNHLVGSLYSEFLLKLAIKYSLYFDPTNNTFSKQQKPGDVPASEIPKNSQLLIQYSNAISLRATSSINGVLGHDQFMYKCFGVIESIASHADPKELVEAVAEHARFQNIRYLELMVGLSSLKQLASSFKELPSNPKIKFIVEISRVQPDDSIFEQNVKNAIEIIKEYPEHIVAFNIVGPEDHFFSQTHFKQQMEIIQRLWKENQQIKIALHGGELTQQFSSPDYLKDRIKMTIQNCHRLGHGVSITEEENAPAVLKEMKDKRIANEACLSSNKGILNVSGKQHPIHTYLKHKVPLVLGSDDCGVNRADLCEQFFLAMYENGLSYCQLKKMIRNSLEFSFLPGESIFINKKTKCFQSLFSGLDQVDWVESEEVRKFLETSERAREQVALERQFVEFEMEMVKFFAQKEEEYFLQEWYLT